MQCMHFEFTYCNIFWFKKRKQKSYRYRYLREEQRSNLLQHLKLYKSVKEGPLRYIAKRIRCKHKLRICGEE